MKLERNGVIYSILEQRTNLSIKFFIYIKLVVSRSFAYNTRHDGHFFFVYLINNWQQSDYGCQEYMKLTDITTINVRSWISRLRNPKNAWRFWTLRPRSNASASKIEFMFTPTSKPKKNVYYWNVNTQHWK